jgi:hypothetical protein
MRLPKFRRLREVVSSRAFLPSRVVNRSRPREGFAKAVDSHVHPVSTISPSTSIRSTVIRTSGSWPSEFHPGDACDGRSGFLAGEGGE